MPGRARCGTRPERCGRCVQARLEKRGANSGTPHATTPREAERRSATPRFADTSLKLVPRLAAPGKGAERQRPHASSDVSPRQEMVSLALTPRRCLEVKLASENG